jgi:endonuclease-3
MSEPVTTDEAHEIVRILRQTYALPRQETRRAPLDELVSTILSQSTTDRNCERAFQALRAAYPAWDDVRRASVEDVAAAIRTGGLANQKAPRIQQVVGRVLDERLLDDIDTLPLDEARERLLSLPGVGPKTAACVLLFACGRPALPVDTHVHRVATRIGLVPPGTSAEQAHRILEAIVEPDDVYCFHIGMIAHGRAVCHARKPRCGECVLSERCRYVQEISENRAAEHDHEYH